MNAKNIFTISAVIGLLFGLAFLLLPGQMAAWYGNEPNTASIVTSRYWSASLLGMAVMYWMGRSSQDSIARKAMIASGFVVFILGFIVSVWGVLTGGLNALGWTSVVLTLLVGLGFGYLLFMKSSDT